MADFPRLPGKSVWRCIVGGSWHLIEFAFGDRGEVIWCGPSLWIRHHDFQRNWMQLITTIQAGLSNRQHLCAIIFDRILSHIPRGGLVSDGFVCDWVFRLLLSEKRVWYSPLRPGQKIHNTQDSGLVTLFLDFGDFEQFSIFQGPGGYCILK